MVNDATALRLQDGYAKILIAFHRWTALPEGSGREALGERLDDAYQRLLILEEALYRSGYRGCFLKDGSCQEQPILGCTYHLWRDVLRLKGAASFEDFLSERFPANWQETTPQGHRSIAPRVDMGQKRLLV